MSIDDQIKENVELLKAHLDYLEKEDTDVMYIISRITNRLNQLFRQKEGFTDYSGKVKDE